MLVSVQSSSRNRMLRVSAGLRQVGCIALLGRNGVPGGVSVIWRLASFGGGVSVIVSIIDNGPVQFPSQASLIDR
jgi:hypothetical protein